MKNRRSIRLPEHDYSSPGLYYVTLCIRNMECLLGNIDNSVNILNQNGQIVESVIEILPSRYGGVFIDEYVIMPNHVHLILSIGDIAGRAIRESPLQSGESPLSYGQFTNCPGEHSVLPTGPYARRKMTLSKIIGFIKMNSAKQINQDRDVLGIPVWHRNYYEHIIRNEDELNQIRIYIIKNPINWNPTEDTIHTNVRTIHELPKGAIGS